MTVYLWTLLPSALTAVLAYNLGVRRERGRQDRYREMIATKRVRRKGIKLRRVKFRR